MFTVLRGGAPGSLWLIRARMTETREPQPPSESGYKLTPTPWRRQGASRNDTPSPFPCLPPPIISGAALKEHVKLILAFPRVVNLG